jgi:hypothetical protein
MKKWFGFIDSRPLIWFHYVLLVGATFAGFYVVDYFGLPMQADNAGLFSQVWILLFAFYVVWIGVSDQIIHRVLKVD